MNNFSNSDKILIVGGTGFIGKKLAERCLESTSQITCLGLPEKNKKEPPLKDLEILDVDINKKENIKNCLKDRPFDYVINVGGYIDHEAYFTGGRAVIETHFSGLLNLMDSLDKESLKTFVQVGSSDEYGLSPAPQKETMREMPISPYALAKTAASHFIQMLHKTEGFPGVVLRLFLVYGPGQDGRRFLPQVIKGCLENDSFKTSEGKQIRDFCYIEDVIDAIIRAALSPTTKGHIINIASGIPISIREVILKTVNIIGGGRPLWGALPYKKCENMALYADDSLAKSLLKWEPRTKLEDGLKKTIDYFKRTMTGE